MNKRIESIRLRHTLLSNNEFNYQIEHIDQLCDDFYHLQVSLSKNLPVRGGSRLVWLLRNHKQLAEQILEYEETIKRNPVIRELVEILGKKHQSSRKRFKMTAGIHREQIISHATRSDITGICEGNDQNSLLPLEYCYLAEKSLQPIFFERFIEKRLQVIDYQSQEKQPINDKKIAGNKISEEAEGPFFVCLDTSVFTVNETVFNPPPKVKSAVVRLRRNGVDRLDCDERLFVRVVKASFGQRRKMLRNSLRAAFGDFGGAEHPFFRDGNRLLLFTSSTTAGKACIALYASRLRKDGRFILSIL